MGDPRDEAMGYREPRECRGWNSGLIGEPQGCSNGYQGTAGMQRMEQWGYEGPQG